MLGRWRARRAQARTPWRQLAFVVVDFETTGLDVRRDRPLSVGWVPIRDGRIIMSDAGYQRIRPEGAVPTASMGIHGLLPEDLVDAWAAEAVGAQLRAALEGHLLVAHGAAMEVGMLRQCGVEVSRRDVVDTIGLVRALERLEGRPVPSHVSLALTATRAGLPVHRSHHAFGDALTTAGVFLSLATGLERREAATRGALVRLGRTG